MKIQAVPIQAKEKQPHREGQSCQNIQRDSVRLSFAFGRYKTKSFPSILPRAPDGRDTAGRPWQGCHNSAASFKACAAGFPLKSVGGREKVSLTPALSSRPECLSGSKVCVDRSDSLSHHLLEAIVLAAHLMSLITRVSYLQYRIFSCHGSVKGEENVSFTYHIF